MSYSEVLIITSSPRMFDALWALVAEVSRALYSAFIRRRQSSGFYRRLLKPISDHVLINRASKERELHQELSNPTPQFDRL